MTVYEGPDDEPVDDDDLDILEPADDPTGNYVGR